MEALPYALVFLTIGLHSNRLYPISACRVCIGKQLMFTRCGVAFSIMLPLSGLRSSNWLVFAFEYERALCMSSPSLFLLGLWWWWVVGNSFKSWLAIFFEKCVAFYFFSFCETLFILSRVRAVVVSIIFFETENLFVNVNVMLSCLQQILS